jgi:hypothetical protein
VASSRYTVLNTITAALKNSTGILNAEQDLVNWWELPQKCPHVTVMDEETEREWAAFPSTSADDMMATMTVTVRGYVHDRANKMATKRTNLIADIEKTMLSSTAINAVVEGVYPGEVRTDDGTILNYSVTDSDFNVVYFYNHLSP